MNLYYWTPSGMTKYTPGVENYCDGRKVSLDNTVMFCDIEELPTGERLEAQAEVREMPMNEDRRITELARERDKLQARLDELERAVANEDSECYDVLTRLIVLLHELERGEPLNGRTLAGFICRALYPEDGE